jgi:hypothetical protein
MALMTIEEARPAQLPAGGRAPLFALGFRPF